MVQALRFPVYELTWAHPFVIAGRRQSRAEADARVAKAQSCQRLARGFAGKDGVRAGIKTTNERGGVAPFRDADRCSIPARRPSHVFYTGVPHPAFGSDFARPREERLRRASRLCEILCAHPRLRSASLRRASQDRAPKPTAAWTAQHPRPPRQGRSEQARWQPRWRMRTPRLGESAEDLRPGSRRRQRLRTRTPQKAEPQGKQSSRRPAPAPRPRRRATRARHGQNNSPKPGPRPPRCRRSAPH